MPSPPARQRLEGGRWSRENTGVYTGAVVAQLRVVRRREPDWQMIERRLSPCSSRQAQTCAMRGPIIHDKLELEPPHTSGDGSVLALATALLLLLGFIANWMLGF